MEFLAFLFFAIERGGVRSLVTCEPEAMTLEKIKLLGVALHDEGEKAIANLGLGQHISFEMCADPESHFEEFHFLRISPEQVRQFAVAINGLDGFDDLGDLTMFADNLVPHVLRVEGVLEFSPELLTRISAVDDITVGSPEEIEIRACGVHAVELLTTAVQTRSIDPRPTLTVGALDNILWNTGSDARYKTIPRHRSRCVFY